MSVVKINALTVPEGAGDELASRFAKRLGAVDGQPGFEEFQLLRPTDDRTTWLVYTRWADDESFQAWMAGASFGQGHQPAEGPSPRLGRVGALAVPGRAALDLRTGYRVMSTDLAGDRPTGSSAGVDDADSDARPHWRGINHLALVTPDMDATVRFYHGVLGMRLVTTLMAGPMRHYFFEIAPGNTVAFFEVPAVPTFKLAAGIADPRKAQLDHLSFNLPDLEALHALRRRLQAHACEVTEVVDHGMIQSLYFNDPHGIALEASYWTADATGHDTDYTDDRFFSDPAPVPAVAELASPAGLTWMPATTLETEEPVDFAGA